MSHPDPQFDPTITDGLYFYMPAEEYHRLDRLNNGTIRDMRESPALAKFNRTNPKRRTRGMDRGTDIHCGVLEPERFSQLYVATPPHLIGVDRRTKPWLEFAKSVEANKQETLQEGVLECVRAILAKRIVVPGTLQRVTINEFLQDCKTEVTALGNEPLRGVASKARADAVHGSGLIVDLKTTEEAIDRMSFESRMYRRAEHFQGQHYLGVFNDAEDTSRYERFMSINVRFPAKYIQGMPFQVEAYNIGEPFLELARKEMAPLIDRYLQCVATGDWSDDDVKVQTALPPGWALATAEEIA